MKTILLILSVFYVGLSISFGQSSFVKSASSPSNERQIYIGVEGVIFAKHITQFTKKAPFLAAADKDFTPGPAFIVGYQANPCLALEIRVQDLPIMTGYSYERATTTTYQGFGASYTQDYLYLPIHAIWRVVGLKSRLGLSLIAGGGPAWTSTKDGLITPNGTEVFTSSSNGSIGVGPPSSTGGVVTATVTQFMTRQQGFFMAVEAGLRGTWQILPRLGLDITARQLWGTTQSARDIDLTIQTDNTTINTTMKTPVRGICTGLSVRFLL